MSPKSGVPQITTHIPCPLLIVIKTLKFLEGILISTTFASSRYDKNGIEEQIITQKKSGWKPEIIEHRSKVE